MAELIIRNLDEDLGERLRIRAAEHGHSMEDEAKDILRMALSLRAAGTQDLVAAIRARLGSTGGADLEIPVREATRTPPDLQ